MLHASSLVVAQSAPPLVPFRGLVDHVSVGVYGWPLSTSVDSGPHAISGDGRYVVVDSYSPDLVPNDFNGDSDVFLRDRAAGTTTRVSVADGGGEAIGGSTMSSISANGRHIAFASNAANLVAGDTNGHWDVFVRDLDAHRTVRVSVAANGAEADADSSRPMVSANGRFVAFLSPATTLAAGIAPYQGAQAYIHDRDSDGNGVFDEAGGTSTTIVSTAADGSPANAMVDGVRVSDDGRLMLFETIATNLDPTVPSPNWANHLYLRNTRTGELTMIDRAVTGGPSAWGVDYRAADLSGDGRFVTFTSPSNDIVWFDMNWTSQVFRYDTTLGPIATAIVSALPDGTLASGSSYASSVSLDGRYVAFVSYATNLAAPAPPATAAGAFVRDTVDGTFTRVDVVDGGAGFDHQYPLQPSVSADGTAIAFSSNAQNAVDGMFTWYADHTFVATAFTASPILALHPGSGSAGVVDVNTTAVSGWKASTYDSWIALSDGADYAAGPRAVQYFIAPNDTGIARDGTIRVGSTIVRVHQDGDGDTTPPVIVPTVAGTAVGDGWYIGSVTVQFTVSDPDSEIVAQSPNCQGVTISSDAMYAPVTCEATSHGGTSTSTVVIRIDNSAPTIDIARPAPTVYAAGETVVPEFACLDAPGYSGVAGCAITAGSSPLDTTPGRHVFTVTAVDHAGHLATNSVEYLAGTGVCVTPTEALKAWWRFDGTTAGVVSDLTAHASTADPLVFAGGVAGQSWQAQGQGYLAADDGQRLLAFSGLTIAAWVRPTGALGEHATIVSKPAQYRVARFLDGTLRWAFSTTAGFDWVNTGVVLPGNVWTHVAISYDAGVVSTYVNGRLAHTQALAGELTTAADPSLPLSIGGRADAAALYFGWIDELQIFEPALAGSDIDAIALAGSAGVCAPSATTLVVGVPAAVVWRDTVPATATLVDADGHAVAGRLIEFHSHIGGSSAYDAVAFGTTDAVGQAHVDSPMSPNAAAGVYAGGVTAAFAGDVHDTAASGAADATVVTRTPTITWPAPNAIAYGTALGNVQLNATASAGGTFTYTPPAGTILAAGTQTLEVAFAPTDPNRWSAASATTTVVVTRATPAIAWTPPFGIIYGTPLGAAQLNASANVPGTFTYSPLPGTVLPYGSYTLTATFTPDDAVNYTAAAVARSLAVGPAELLIVVNSASKPYGAPLPVFSATTTGFVNGDSYASLAGALTFSTTATAASDIGAYPIVARGVSSPNYTIRELARHAVGRSSGDRDRRRRVAESVGPQSACVLRRDSRRARARRRHPDRNHPVLRRQCAARHVRGRRRRGVADNQRLQCRRAHRDNDLRRRFALCHEHDVGGVHGQRVSRLVVDHRDLVRQPVDGGSERHAHRNDYWAVRCYRQRSLLRRRYADRNGAGLLRHLAADDERACVGRTRYHGALSRQRRDSAEHLHGVRAVRAAVGREDARVHRVARRITVARDDRLDGDVDRDGHRIESPGADRSGALSAERIRARSECADYDGIDHFVGGVQRGRPAPWHARGRRNLCGRRGVPRVDDADQRGRELARDHAAPLAPDLTSLQSTPPSRASLAQHLTPETAEDAEIFS